MGKVLIIGAGGVGSVVAYKVAQHPEVFSEIVLASRTKAKCDKIAAFVGNKRIQTDQVDADSVEQLVALFKKHRPELVIHVALPYQDLTIMDACLACGVHYLDTANYEPKDKAHFEYSWQWAYKERFEKAGLTAILGCGFDPGVTGVWTAYAAKHHFDEIHYLDIVDCNAGDHGKAFATNFNPEINIREVTQKGRYYENGQWIETEPHQIHKTLNYPEIGPRESYLIYHEELESLVKNFPTIKRARFWMTFGEEYLTHLRVIQNIGMDGMEDEFGDLLFSLINVARLYGINPDNALEHTNKKFRERFNYLEAETLKKGLLLKEMSLDQMEVIWQQAKKHIP
jgi:saccharopine dehydrogenase (NAD+, L-lysine-forming)